MALRRNQEKAIERCWHREVEVKPSFYGQWLTGNLLVWSGTILVVLNGILCLVVLIKQYERNFLVKMDSIRDMKRKMLPRHDSKHLPLGTLLFEFHFVRMYS